MPSFVKIAFFVVVILSLVVNLAGWLMEKIYRKKMSAKAKEKEFENFYNNN